MAKKSKKNKGEKRRSKNYPKEGKNFGFLPHHNILINTTFFSERFIVNPIRKYNSLFTRYRILYYLASCVGYGALAYSVITLGIPLLFQLFTDFKISNLFSIYDVIDIAKFSTPLFIAFKFIFTFLSLGFLTSLLDMEEMFEDAALENRSAPWSKIFIKGFAFYTGAQFTIFPLTFEVIAIIFVVSFLLKYALLIRSRGNEFLLKRARYWVKERKLLFRYRDNYYLYNIYSKKVTKFPMSKREWKKYVALI